MVSRWKKLNNNRVFNIGELGFGAGINFLTTLKMWSGRSNTDNWLNYFSIENQPICIRDLRRIHKKYPELHSFSLLLIKKYPINCKGLQRIEFPKQKVSLTVYYGEVKQCLNSLSKESLSFDAWFLDGFSPNLNPDMWSSEIFKLVAKLSNKSSTFATFSSAKLVRKNLEKSGFSTEKVRGFLNKRSMLIGEFKNGKLKKKKRFKKKVGIIGAGIAGCSLAKTLSSRGHEVTLFEKKSNAAEGSSGNSALVLYPRLSAFKTPYADFCLHSYLFSTRFYEEIGKPHWNKTGVLLLSFNSESQKRQQILLSTRNDSKIFKKVEPKEASEIAGIKIEKEGLFFPNAGWLDSNGACKDMLENPEIKLVKNEKIEFIEKNKKFKIYSSSQHYQFDHICLCTSYETNKFINIKGLTKKRGQVTQVENNDALKYLKLPVCASGYISPTNTKSKLLGSTYNDKDIDTISFEDHEENLKKIEAITSIRMKINGGKVGFRATSPDHLPFVGKVNNIFIDVAHGSRGTTSAPICAQYICDLISESPPLFNLSLTKSLNPERFSEQN